MSTTTHQSIKEILITAATHGNEMSGIAAIKQWQQHSSSLTEVVPSANVFTKLINERAQQHNTRYIDEDLNRLFKPQILLTNTQKNNEQTIAASFNDTYGPKGTESKTDLIIDIHNTTSNMGPTLIIMERSDFYRDLARYVKHNMPEANILLEDFQPYSDFGYLCTVAKRGVMIEVGPQPQGILRYKAYTQTVEMTEWILKFVQLFNTKQVPLLDNVEAFQLGREIKYPTHKHEDKEVQSAILHPSLEGQDFKLLKHNQPCFIDLNGNVLNWQEQDTYPHFIGESAYQHLNVAFATSTKIFV